MPSLADRWGLGGKPGSKRGRPKLSQPATRPAKKPRKAAVIAGEPAPACHDPSEAGATDEAGGMDVGDADQSQQEHLAAHCKPADSKKCARCRHSWVIEVALVIVKSSRHSLGREHSANDMQLPALRFYRMQQRWSSLSSLKHGCWGKKRRTVWLQEKPSRRQGKWGVGCHFCAHLVNTLAQNPAQRKALSRPNFDSATPAATVAHMIRLEPHDDKVGCL